MPTATYFNGFVYFAVSRVGEGAFLLGKEGCAEQCAN